MSALLQAPARRRRTGRRDQRPLAGRAVRRGDDRAFEALYERYHRRIHAYVYGMVKDHQRAEDVTQEVFVSALRRMRATERPIAFKPWVYEIAKNACIDQFRRSKRAEEISFDADEGLAPSDYGRLVSPEPVPDAALAAKQQLDHMVGAFGGLSEAHHQILVLRELEGLSYREIGERMGMSRPAVESTLFRARRRLSEEYDELASGSAACASSRSSRPPTSGRLGARDTRRLARHVAHCQPCRRQALAAGVDSALVARRPLRRRAVEKVAALFPFPLLLRRRRGGGGRQLVEPAAAALRPRRRRRRQAGRRRRDRRGRPRRRRRHAGRPARRPRGRPPGARRRARDRRAPSERHRAGLRRRRGARAPRDRVARRARDARDRAPAGDAPPRRRSATRPRAGRRPRRCRAGGTGPAAPATPPGTAGASARDALGPEHAVDASTPSAPATEAPSASSRRSQLPTVTVPQPAATAAPSLPPVDVGPTVDSVAGTVDGTVQDDRRRRRRSRSRTPPASSVP